MPRIGLSYRNVAWFLSLFLVLACSKSSQKIEFRKLREIPKELEIESELAHQPVPKNPSQLEKTKSFRLERPQFKRLKNGEVLPSLPGSVFLSQGNRPRVPILKYAFEVPHKMKAQVKLLNPEMEESRASIPLARAEKPLVWGKKEVLFEDPIEEGYYPGKLFQSYQSGNRVYVVLYPLQVDLKTGKVLTLSAASWNVQLEPEKTKEVKVAHSPGLILTSEKLLDGAKKLQRFHFENLKLKSEVITVEKIATTESPVELNELPDGYKDEEMFDGIVRKYDPEKKSGYDFLAARKIISFLKKRYEADPSFKYVTILGNSDLVPPSYYFSEKKRRRNVRTGVTDQCYSAGKLCLEPKLAVGRLPFVDNSEVDNYLQKASQWVKKSDWFQSDLALYGGKAFQSSPFYIGELGTLVTVNSETTDWKNVQKHFETDSKFSREEIERLVKGEESASLIYYLDHGTGNRWWAGDEYLTSSEIKNIEPVEGSIAPLMVSVSCINAAFDENLILDHTMEDIGKDGTISVGTALLRSKAGAVAYLGGSRDGLGTPETEIDEDGNVEVLGTSYGLQMFDGFIATYRKNKNQRLGDALLENFESYLFKSGNDLEDFNHRWTFWITELLGDPAMPSVRMNDQEKGYPLAQADFDDLDHSSGFPNLKWEKSEKKTSQLALARSAGPVTAKVFEMVLGLEGFDGQKLIKTQKFERGEDRLELHLGKELLQGKQYLIKLSNDEGVPRERHLVFSTASSKE